jgi:hypothetical protein
MGGVNMKMLGKVLAASFCIAGAAANVEAKQDSQWQGEQPATEGTLSASPGTYTKDNYPSVIAARPLILPPWMGQAGLVFGVNNTPGLTGTNIQAAFDIGVMEKLQVGGTIGFPLSNPDPDFGNFFANAQYGATDYMNLRVDVGAVKQPGAGGSTGFAFGVGAPVKYLFNDMLAFVSGRPYAWATGDDILQMQFVNGAKLGIINIPLGLVAQVHPNVAVGLRTGVKFGFADFKIAGNTPVFIPVGADLMVNVLRDLDVGLAFDLPGNKDAYADVRQIGIWAMYRL